MKVKTIVRFVLHRLTRVISFVARRNPPPAPPPVQLALDLDQVTESGLRLRETLPVRSAEYWLQLGAPDVALQELETLPEPVRQHDWPRRVRFAARIQLTQTS